MAAPASDRLDPRGDAWLALGPASRLVGVDPDTLRRWADAGRVRAYATPGGHRRFRRRDLERVVAARRPTTRPLDQLGATPARFTRAYARAYRSGAPIAPEGLPDDARAAFRAEGRRLVAVILAYLDAPEPDRARWADEAIAIIAETGRRLAAAGADAEAAIGVYVRARRPLLGELAAIGRRRALDVTQLAETYQEAVELFDRLLLELVHAHGAALDRQETTTP